MYEAFNINIWFSPRYAINYLWSQVYRNGQRVLASNKFKKERGAWIMGVALFGVMKIFKTRWWLQIPLTDPPDMLAMTIATNKEMNINEMHHREIEIMQITKYTKNEIDEEILRKLKNKAYIKETGLVVYLNRTTLIQDMRSLSTKIKEEKINIADIWILGLESKNSEDYVFFSLLPDVQVIRFNLKEEMDNLGPGDTIEMSRSKGTKMELVKNVALTKFIPK